ncbi:MAG: tyrosine-protein phosphatase [Steroidobacteraceae bacterium]
MTISDSALDQARSKRVLPLQGGRNFRDLGGYITADGRRLRWGRVYRSGVMAYFTPEDRTHLDTLGIRTVCDFRTPQERKREPTSWNKVPEQCLTWEYDHRAVSLRGYLDHSAPLTEEIARGCMALLYRKLPSTLAQVYTDFLVKLSAGELPLVFHCSAGKDRTGFAAALLLTTLGVPREQIYADFTLTNDVVDLERELFEHPRSSVGLGEDRNYLMKCSREARSPLLKAFPEYLDAAFETVEQDHGSVESYVRNRLGIDATAVKRMQAHLLEE